LRIDILGNIDAVLGVFLLGLAESFVVGLLPKGNGPLHKLSLLHGFEPDMLRRHVFIGFR